MKFSRNMGLAILVAVPTGVGFFIGASGQPTPGAIASFLESHPEFLVDNPDLIERSRPVAAKRFQQHERERRLEIMDEAWDEFLGAATTPRLGAVNDPIVVVEFTDYACVPCKVSAERIEFIAATNPDTQFVIAYVPTGESSAEYAARTGLVVWNKSPTGFADMHWELMATPVVNLAEEADRWLVLNGNADSDLHEELGTDSVRTTLRRSRELFDQLGARVIPSFVIDGELLVGPVSNAQLQAAIDSVRDGLNP